MINGLIAQQLRDLAKEARMSGCSADEAAEAIREMMKPRFRIGSYLTDGDSVFCVIGDNQVLSLTTQNVYHDLSGFKPELYAVPAKDVIISLGCMCGKVRNSLYADGDVDSSCFLLMYADNAWNEIDYDSLPSWDQSTVKSLLKAQEDEA